MDFSKLNGLVPCVVQDADTDKVLMLGFMNEEAYLKSLAEKQVTFYSRSKQRLWTKGETSGNWLEITEIKEDCDQDSLLIKVIPKGPVCHTGADTCFNETNDRWNLKLLERVILDRKTNPKSDSYTSKLFESGINKITQKVGEEAVELVIEAKDNNQERFTNEAADLLFHFLVLLSAKNSNLDDVLTVLKGRHKNQSED